MIDVEFPHIIFNETLSSYENGFNHGREFSQAIAELSQIRRGLLIQRSPHLKENINALAQDQFNETKAFDNELSEELRGISDGSGCPIEDIIIINNYTDFRDINLPEEGCSTIGVNTEQRLSGQTWDMHSTAKNYVCIIENPGKWTVFSLVGCLGMMGANKDSLFVGVNNMNTTDAKPGIVWPAFVRKSLQKKNVEEVMILAKSTSFTGAHNYLFSDLLGSRHQEISPTRNETASEFKNKGTVFHTNHCLTAGLIEIEEKLSVNSTSKERFKLLESAVPKINTEMELIELLQSHEGYPKSICGHFQSGAQDPSITCGGGVFNHETKDFFFWRGCPKEDPTYKEIKIKLS